MLAKLQVFAQTVKQVLLYVLLPVIGVCAYIYYLLVQNRKLTEEVKQEKFDVTHNQTVEDQAKIDAAASDAVAKYRALNAAYLSGGSDSVLPGSVGTDPANTDPGSKN